MMQPYGRQSYEISMKPRTDLYIKKTARQKAKKQIKQEVAQWQVN